MTLFLNAPLSEAIRAVNAGEQERICEPGKWRVSLGDDGEIEIATGKGLG